MIASSAARWSVSASSRCVSSNRRAFSRATLRLAGERRQEPDVGLAEGVRSVEVLERDDADRHVPREQRHEHEPTCGFSPTTTGLS